jgi:hypothetical protein
MMQLYRPGSNGQPFERLAQTVGPAFVLAIVVACTWTTEPAYGGSVKQHNSTTGQRRQIHQSELSLRACVEETNLQLRQLKRDFVQHMSDLYMGFRLNPLVGYEKARRLKLYVASANVLVAEQFADMLVKRHIIERRLSTGLKLNYIKMLPMSTLANLYNRYESFEWLRYQQQVDIRPKFPGATEEELSLVYKLIGLRAQVRAAEDVLALTSDNIRRILQIAQHYFVEKKNNNKVADSNELPTFGRHIKQVLTYYLDEVVGWHARLHSLYETYLDEAKPLAKRLSANQKQDNQEAALVTFLDRLTNVEALDIGLNQEAKSYEYPPTISDEIINKLQKDWIPVFVLDSLQADRKLILTNRKRVMHLVKLDPNNQDTDLSKWSKDVYTKICFSLQRY